MKNKDPKKKKKRNSAKHSLQLCNGIHYTYWYSNVEKDRLAGNMQSQTFRTAIKRIRIDRAEEEDEGEEAFEIISRFPT